MHLVTVHVEGLGHLLCFIKNPSPQSKIHVGLKNSSCQTDFHVWVSSHLRCHDAPHRRVLNILNPGCQKRCQALRRSIQREMQ